MVKATPHVNSNLGIVMIENQDTYFANTSSMFAISPS